MSEDIYRQEPDDYENIVKNHGFFACGADGVSLHKRTEVSCILQQHGEILYSDQEIEQEKLDEVIQWYEKVYEWVDRVDEALE